MKKLFVWIVRIAVLVLIVKVVLWSWEQYQLGSIEEAPQQVSDFDKVCDITNADTGSCVCTHRQTGERLKVSYEECVGRVHKRRSR